MVKIKKWFSVVAVVALFAAPSFADPLYVGHKQVDHFIDEMVTEHGFEENHLESLFAKVAKKQSIIDAMNRPAEKVMTWKSYRKLFIHPKNIENGKAFLNEHRETFDKAEARYGVPREIIAAIIGVETRYGRIMGRYRVIDALSTLAFDYPKRSKFFRSELKHFLILTRDQGTDPLAHVGSYAGAMGYGQFMPSSYRSYAVDFDGDDLIDIWENPVDAIGSVANYLSRHGWSTNEKVTIRARADKNHDDSVINASLKPAHKISELQEKGFRPVDGADSDAPATAIKLQGEWGDEYWVGLNNFYVITRYNHSRLYAMAVFQLSEGLRG